MIHKRDRKAQRADKWWASVWLRQMCMAQPIVWGTDPELKQSKTEDV